MDRHRRHRAILFPASSRKSPSASGLSLLLLILGSCALYYPRLTLRPAEPFLRVMLAAFLLFDLGAFNWLEADKNSRMKRWRRLLHVILLTRQPSSETGPACIGQGWRAHRSLPTSATSTEQPFRAPGEAAPPCSPDFRIRFHEEIRQRRLPFPGPATTTDEGAIYHDEQ